MAKQLIKVRKKMIKNAQDIVMSCSSLANDAFKWRSKNTSLMKKCAYSVCHLHNKDAFESCVLAEILFSVLFKNT